jgi:hypothetical protein
VVGFPLEDCIGAFATKVSKLGVEGRVNLTDRSFGPHI